MGWRSGIEWQMLAKDLPIPPDQEPPVPVEEPPDAPVSTPDAPVEDPRPEEPVRQ